MRFVSLEDAKEKLCEEAWKLARPCNTDFLVKLYRSGLANGAQDINRLHDTPGPVVYVLFVAAFYLTIILILAWVSYRQGTQTHISHANLRRLPQAKQDDHQQVVEFTENHGAKCRVLDPSKELDDEDSSLAEPV